MKGFLKSRYCHWGSSNKGSLKAEKKWSLTIREFKPSTLRDAYAKRTEAMLTKSNEKKDAE